jgi:hypothetical protein
LSESVEVRGWHIGLGFNPAALWVIADRLAQPIGQWRRFRPSGGDSALFSRGGKRDLVERQQRASGRGQFFRRLIAVNDRREIPSTRLPTPYAAKVVEVDIRPYGLASNSASSRNCHSGLCSLVSEPPLTSIKVDKRKAAGELREWATGSARTANRSTKRGEFSAPDRLGQAGAVLKSTARMI